MLYRTSKVYILPLAKSAKLIHICVSYQLSARNDGVSLRFQYKFYDRMIVVTGAAGFIGSVLTGILNRKGINELIISDDFTRPDKEGNLAGKKWIEKIDRLQLFKTLKGGSGRIEFFFHIGARTDTTETDLNLLNTLNLDYSKQVWDFCSRYKIPLIYASSAATYGMGEHGHNDDHHIAPKLQPLNAYGRSKNDFDIWALQQADAPPFWAGMRFFNVYGPNEYHKGRMASVVFHAFNQIKETGLVKLFRSHKPEYQDGGQKRDFIYVKDVADVLLFMMNHRPQPGLYNLGTGLSRSFLHLAQGVFSAANKPENIGYIDTPADIREKYQYFTEANIHKLRNAGYDKPFTTLERGIADYVQNYLMRMVNL